MEQPKSIAIIDRGVNPDYHRLSGCRLEEVVISKGSKDAQPPDRLGHGSSLASLIFHQLPDIPIVSVKLSSDTGINAELLALALDYCSQRTDIQIINISLGLVAPHPPAMVFQSAWRCYQNGKVIVAAVYPDHHKICFPAAFPFVYGVDAGRTGDSDRFSYLGEGYVNILAKGTYMRILGENGRPTLGNGSSYATAFFAVILAKAFRENNQLSVGNLKTFLRQSSLPIPRLYASAYRNVGTVWGMHRLVEGAESSPLPFACESSQFMAFPADNKEVDQLIRKASIFDKRLRWVMGYPNVQAPAKWGNARYVPGLLSPKLFQSCNTVVAGNFLEAASLVNIGFGYDLLRLAIRHNIDFVCWHESIHHLIEELIHALGSTYEGNLYPLYEFHPNQEEKLQSFATLPMPATSIIAVIGMGESGKLDSLERQIELREILQVQGLKIGHLATRTHARLLGSEQVFPLEDPPPAKLRPVSEWPSQLNNQLKALHHHRSIDLILTGIQSIWACREEADFRPAFDRLHFLSLLPVESIVLALDPQTTIDRLENALELIERAFHKKPVFFAAESMPAGRVCSWLKQHHPAPLINMNEPGAAGQIREYLLQPIGQSNPQVAYSYK